MPKKRADGEGSVFKRPDGRWEGRTRRDPATGKRRKVTRDTRAEVVAALRELHRQEDDGADLYATPETVKGLLVRWLEWGKARWAPSTLYGYRHTAEAFIIPHIGHIALTDLKALQVDTLVATLGGTTRTAEYARSVLSRALNRAVKWDLIGRNVVQATEAPKVNRRPITILTTEQAGRLFDAAAGHRLEAFYRVVFGLGLRSGEARALLWSSINWEEGALTVDASLRWNNGKLERSKTKTPQSQRVLFLPPEIIEIFRAHYEAQMADKRQMGTRWREHGLIFTSEVGTPIDGASLFYHFKAVLKRAGLPTTIRIHDLRHSFVSFLLVQGVDVRTIADLVGHTNIQTTLNVYAHSTQESRREAAAKIGQVVKRKKAN